MKIKDFLILLGGLIFVCIIAIPFVFACGVTFCIEGCLDYFMRKKGEKQ